ncbi:phosphomevalonate kinase [Ligilactobacillus sp. Marseille-Q7487]|uniref:phosphomevalonate kinase n=1 Tax=Ligilactobacillus sp. Marseille-Q7487 TaxID=3022128 RepID=UPI0024A819B6|nr:phosphomevalonate kinase [Ligilactobacillus sp. Marseille-Q7487]
MIKVKAPGKLYIAGEYAVVENGYPAILVALDQFVYVSVEKSSDYGSIISKQYQEDSLYWRRQGDQIIFDHRDNPFHYILTAIDFTEKYAQSLGKKLDCYHLKIDSQLDSPEGKKYGLGSSAAVTVATVKALCRYYDLPVTKNELFKLAAIIHFEVQGNGSLGDIAASVYGGWIAYHSVDRNWLVAARNTYSLAELLVMPWPKLKIESLPVLDNLQLLIGWTGSPASTSHLVDAVTLKTAGHAKDYHDFLNSSQQCLEKMIDGFKQHDLTTIQKQLRINRQLLKELASLSGVDIETPLLKFLIESAENIGGAAKTSGAGGGDCGIVIIDKNISYQDLFTQWSEHQIRPLAFNVYHIKD